MSEKEETTETKTETVEKSDSTEKVKKMLIKKLP